MSSYAWKFNRDTYRLLKPFRDTLDVPHTEKKTSRLGFVMLSWNSNDKLWWEGAFGDLIVCVEIVFENLKFLKASDIGTAEF